MIVEVLYAVDFICSLLRNRGNSTIYSEDKMNTLHRTLNDRLQRHYDGHWHPKAPERGSGYRCIRFVRHRIDPVLTGVGKEAGFSDRDLLAMLPAELTLWVDPDEVAVRFGEDGSVGIIYGGTGTSNNSSGAGSTGSDSEPEESAMSTSSTTDYSSENESSSSCSSPETVMPIDLVTKSVPTS
jgi:protein Tob/BTG